ncbi:hypothetical protein MY11210_002742 [Beauveria gryllotalpidicola]
MSAPRGDDVLTQSHVAVSDAQDYFNLLPNEIFALVLDFVHGPETDFRDLTELDTRMDTLVVLYLDLRILPDQIDFSSLAALDELTLIYWPLIAGTRVEFSEDVGRRLLAPQMRRLNWLLVGETKPDLYINSLTTFDERWLCDLGEYATQHCSRLRIIHAKHNPLRQFDAALLPNRPVTVPELMPWRIFGRVQLFFRTLGLDFRYETVAAWPLNWLEDLWKSSRYLRRAGMF